MLGSDAFRRTAHRAGRTGGVIDDRLEASVMYARGMISAIARINDALAVFV